MTEIKELLAKINLNPSYLAQINWAIETAEFAKYRIIKIIRGIADSELRKFVGEYISEAWYDACECYTGFYELEDAVGQGCNEYEYRFEPKRNQYSNRINCIHIEDFIQEQLDFYLRNEERKQKLQRLQLKANRDIAALASYDEVDKNSIESLSRYVAENVIKEIEEQDLEECAKQCTKIEEAKQQAQTDAIRRLVEQIIIYAENFPSNQNEKAELIKEVLMAKNVNGHIPSEVLTPELRERLTNLGRKENHVQIGTLNTENLYDVHNNKTVKLK